MADHKEMKISEKLRGRYRVMELEIIATKQGVQDIGDGISVLDKTDLSCKRLRAAFEDVMERANKRLARLREELWDEIYKELDLDPNGSYSINVPTGIVTKNEPRNPLEEIFGGGMGGMKVLGPFEMDGDGPEDGCDCPACTAKRLAGGAVRGDSTLN